MSVRPETIRALYRRLYRTAKSFDKNPFSKVFLYRKEKRDSSAYHDSSANYYNQIIGQIFQDRLFISNPDQITLPLVQILRNEFSAGTTKKRSLNAMVDTGFAAFRNFQSIWSHWIEFEDQRKSRLADAKSLKGNLYFEEMVYPKPGMILITHPLSRRGRTVYLLLQKMKSEYYAVELTKSTNFPLEMCVKNLPEQLQQLFGNERIRLGGPQQRLQVIHRIPELGKLAIPFCKEPFYSSMDLSKLMDYMKQRQESIETENQDSETKNKSLSKDFMFFVGCRYFGVEEVYVAIEKGEFILGQVHPDELFRILMEEETTETSESVLALPSDTPIEDNPEGKGEDEKESGLYVDSFDRNYPDEYIYSSLLRAMGEPYEALLAILPEEDREDVRSCSDW